MTNKYRTILNIISFKVNKWNMYAEEDFWIKKGMPAMKLVNARMTTKRPQSNNFVVSQVELVFCYSPNSAKTSYCCAWIKRKIKHKVNTEESSIGRDTIEKQPKACTCHHQPTQNHTQVIHRRTYKHRSFALSTRDDRRYLTPSPCFCGDWSCDNYNRSQCV